MLESRLDSAFFDEKLIEGCADDGVELTISVPFERLTQLKKLIENRQRWHKIDDTWSYFELDWKPKSWSRQYRFLFARQKRKQPIKGELQLDLTKTLVALPRSFCNVQAEASH